MIGPVFSPPPEPYAYPYNTILLCFAFCWTIMYLPFGISDLYFAYRDTSCVHLIDGNIDMTLGTYLQVDGWVIIGFLILFVIIGALAVYYPEKNCLYVMWENFHLLFILWRLSWLIIGAIMFWASTGFLNTTICDTKISRRRSSTLTTF